MIRLRPACLRIPRSRPTGVFGQTNFTNDSQNLGNPGSPTTSRWTTPIDVKVDTNLNVYIADEENSRVLEFNAPRRVEHRPSREFRHGTIKFRDSILSNRLLLRLPCATPTGVGIDSSGNVFAADYNNNRMLEFPAPLSAHSNTAGAVLGQAVFDMGFPNFVDGKGFAFPPNVTIDPYSTPNHIYVSDGNNPAIGFEGVNQSRVLAWYDAKTFMNGQTADLVFGQPDFYHTAGNNGVNGPGALGPDTLQVPAGMTVDTSSNLYIVDSGNNRVLEYDNPFQGFNARNGPQTDSARYSVRLGRRHCRRSSVR